MSEPVPSTYGTTDRGAYDAALRQRGSLLVWLDPGMGWLAVPRGRRGRPATFPDAAIRTCPMLKALSGLPLRRATGLVAGLLKLAGLDWPGWTGRAGLAGLDWAVPDLEPRRADARAA